MSKIDIDGANRKVENIGAEHSSLTDLAMRQNNFDLLRFMFAFIVFLVHAHILTGADDLSILSKYFSSDLAVKSFFIVSGFLIFMSYENSRSPKSYFVKRVRRIFPAYFFVIILSVILGCIFSTYAWNDYFSFDLLKYVSANLLFLNFLQPNLPGLIEGNHIQAINGALWSLKIEVMFYLSVPLIVMASHKFGRLPVIITLYICSVIYSLVLGEVAVKTGSGFYLELQRQLPGQMTFFLAGAAGYYYLQYLTKYAAWLASLSVVTFVFQSWLPWVVVQPLALGILIVCGARVIPYLGNFGKYGDFSYGIYIIHFPVLQVLASYALFNESPWVMLFIATVLIMTMALLLWHFIEKPFLRKSSHYAVVNPG